MVEENTYWWKCTNCGYILRSQAPPETCPGCQQKCAFVDATCYTPDCGGPGNIAPGVGVPQKLASTPKRST